MKSKYVIHTVGPVWQGGNRDEPVLLANAYRESLKLAAARNLKSISFPSISTGAYGYPVEQAARIAIKEVISFLKEPGSVKEVVFVLFDARTYEAYAEALRDEGGGEGKKQNLDKN
jgi:O-acetyl-ADP-ribose deacetylase (regulator of RNase III)